MIAWQESIKAHPQCFILSRYNLSVISLHEQAGGWVTFSAACIRAVVPFFCRPFTLTPFFISNRRMSSCPPAAANMLRDIPLTSCRHTDTKLQCQIRAEGRSASKWLAVDVRLLFGAKKVVPPQSKTPPLRTSHSCNTSFYLNGETGWQLVRLAAEGAANRCRAIRA